MLFHSPGTDVANGITKKVFKKQPLQTWMLPNLPICYKLLLHAARGIPYGKVHQFSRLHRLLVNLDLQSGWQISCLFDLPSLRELIIDNLQDGYIPEYANTAANWQCKASGSGITSLRFQRCNTTSSMLALAIASCRELEVFLYEFENRWDATKPKRESRLYSNLRNALYEHHDSLK